MKGRVLLMVTGGIAAYKACFLARLLQQAGFSVRCAMTDAAQRFVGPVTLRALTGHPVATDLWGEGQSEALDHVEYARWADLVVVAPATANLLAKAAHGIADDMVTTLLLASALVNGIASPLPQASTPSAPHKPLHRFWLAPTIY